jgi:hypothetical protein
MYNMEALIDILVEKGLVTKEEVLKRSGEFQNRSINRATTKAEGGITPTPLYKRG